MLQIIIDYGKLGVPVVTTLLPILRTSTTLQRKYLVLILHLCRIFCLIAGAASPCLAVGMEGPEVHVGQYRLLNDRPVRK